MFILDILKNDMITENQRSYKLASTEIKFHIFLIKF